MESLILKKKIQTEIIVFLKKNLGMECILCLVAQQEPFINLLLSLRPDV